MNNTIISAVDDLIAEIKETKNYRRLLELKHVMDNDSNITQLISNFSESKAKYDEVVKFGEHHPNLQKVKLELSKAKLLLFNHEIVSEYKALEKEMQKVLDEISKKIAQTISLRIKYPNEIGLINKH